MQRLSAHHFTNISKWCWNLSVEHLHFSVVRSYNWKIKQNILHLPFRFQNCHVILQRLSAHHFTFKYDVEISKTRTFAFFLSYRSTIVRPCNRNAFSFSKLPCHLQRLSPHHFTLSTYTIKSKTAKLRRITSYQGVLELWLGMSLNYYYIISKAYLAIILDNP